MVPVKRPRWTEEAKEEMEMKEEWEFDSKTPDWRRELARELEPHEVSAIQANRGLGP